MESFRLQVASETNQVGTLSDILSSPHAVKKILLDSPWLPGCACLRKLDLAAFKKNGATFRGVRTGRCKDCGAPASLTCFMIACANNCQEVAEELMGLLLAPNVDRRRAMVYLQLRTSRVLGGNSAMHLAASRDASRSIKAIFSGSHGKLMSPTEKKALLFQRNGSNDTSLILAAATNSHNALSSLLGVAHAAGGSELQSHFANKKNLHGVTATMVAARAGDSKSLEYLFEAGAKPALEDNLGRTVVFYAGLADANRAVVEQVIIEFVSKAEACSQLESERLLIDPKNSSHRKTQNIEPQRSRRRREERKRQEKGAVNSPALAPQKLSPASTAVHIEADDDLSDKDFENSTDFVARDPGISLSDEGALCTPQSEFALSAAVHTRGDEDPIDKHPENSAEQIWQSLSRGRHSAQRASSSGEHATTREVEPMMEPPIEADTLSDSLGNHVESAWERSGDSGVFSPSSSANQTAMRCSDPIEDALKSLNDRALQLQLTPLNFACGELEQLSVEQLDTLLDMFHEGIRRVVIARKAAVRELEDAQAEERARILELISSRAV